MMLAQDINRSTEITPKELFSQKIYWLNKLSGEIPETTFLTDYVRPTNLTAKDKSIDFELSNDLSQYLIQFTNKSYFSIYLILLATLNILLYNYTGNNDIIVGSPIHKQIDKNISASTLVPLRSNVKNELKFTDFLSNIKKTVIDGYSHPHFNLEEILHLFNLPQSQNRHPIFDIVILLENIHNYDCLSNINNDITFSFVVVDNIIKCKVEYKNLLFRDDNIQLIIGRYINILGNIFQDWNIKISDIPYLTAVEKNKLLNEFNNNSKDFPVNQTIQQLFEEQVRLTPNNIAVVCEGEKFTYQELNAKANQIARLLRNSGVKPGEYIGILKQRDRNFLIAILAILKAGGVYVPIDSSYPKDRVRYMVSDSEVRFLLTDSLYEFTDLLKDYSQLKYFIILDSKSGKQSLPATSDTIIYNQRDFDNLSTENLDINCMGIDPAYMIYTSGSTGLPKGAVIRHGGAINHIYTQLDALNLNEELIFLQSAPASSDISVWQFLAPILIGGKTIIVDTETVCNPEKFFKVIQEENITIIELVPVILTSLLNYIDRLSPDERLLPNLKWMMVTGESASVEIVNRWLGLYPSIKVVNAYGPTEAADDITQMIVDQPLPENQRTVPIGKPLANLNLYILNSQTQLVPIGVPGEICVSGFGVGLGYWKNPEQTNLSFVANPFTTIAKPLPGTNTDLIYKTGDWGRWLPDGNIEFLGRIDNQVKIRGFRIELGEIESLLRQHHSVKEGVVIIREDNVGEKRLVAYVVPAFEEVMCNQELELKAEDSVIIRELILQLRDFLKQKLPEYMLPSSFVLLEKLPLTPSAKVDRQALPAPEPLKPELAKTFVAPITSVEEILAKIWAQVLGVGQVGIHDNFFELGGDSILCIQVIAKAQQEALNITLKQIFQYQTIAELAKVVDTTETIEAEQGVLTGEVLLTPIQHYVFEQNLANPHHWNQAVLLEVQRAIDPKLLEQVVEQLIVHHDALRLRFEPTESGWRQFYTQPDKVIPCVNGDLSSLPPDKQASALEATATELQVSLNLFQGPLIRVALFNLAKEKTSRLLLVIHHLVVDSLSWRILIEDLQTAYQQAEQGQAIALPTKTTSLRQWSEKLQEYANSPQLQQELDYWLAEKRRHITHLPVDQPGGANTEALADTVSIKLSVAETQILLQEIPALYRIQINDLLLVPLVQAFAQWTGCKHLLVDLEGHGREEIFDNLNLSRTVGLFSSIFPVFLDLEAATQPAEALKTIKEQIRAIPNKGIGYGILRYLCNDPQIVESLHSLPRAEVVFNYLGQFDQTFSESSMFTLAQESTGSEISLQNDRSHLLAFDSFVVGGQLQVNCTYSKAIHHRSTIATLIEMFVQGLRSLINHSLSADANNLTPSDFPLLDISQDQLDAALGMVEF
jgi:amino acid adenylation domain-containing protein/non-ribosomal peptide synthase protein (TIGR01720 family)